MEQLQLIPGHVCLETGHPNVSDVLCVLLIRSSELPRKRFYDSVLLRSHNERCGFSDCESGCGMSGPKPCIHEPKCKYTYSAK